MMVFCTIHDVRKKQLPSPSLILQTASACLISLCTSCSYNFYCIWFDFGGIYTIQKLVPTMILMEIRNRKLPFPFYTTLFQCSSSSKFRLIFAKLARPTVTASTAYTFPTSPFFPMINSIYDIVLWELEFIMIVYMTLHPQ